MLKAQNNFSLEYVWEHCSHKQTEGSQVKGQK
jgi:hypothetical protein